MKVWSHYSIEGWLEDTCFPLHPRKSNGWNLKINRLKRKIIWTKPSFLGVPAVTLPKTNVTMENPPFEDVCPFGTWCFFSGFFRDGFARSICGKHRPGGLQLHVDLPRRHTIPNPWCWVSAWILGKNDGLFEKKQYPKNPWTLQWKGLNLYSRGPGPENCHFWGVRILRVAWKRTTVTYISHNNEKKRKQGTRNESFFKKLFWEGTC